MYTFNYHRPASLDQTKELLSSLEDPKILAGGMTLLPTMKQRLASPSDLIDLADVDGLRELHIAEGRAHIGAMCRHVEVESSDTLKAGLPVLAALAGHIGDPQVRNRGTAGGSIANADPAADYPAAVLALKGEVTTSSRTIGADDFFVDLFETALKEDEIIQSVSFAVPECAAYMKFPNPASRYAIVGVLVAKFDDGVRVAVTGAGPNAFRVAEMESRLNERFDASAIEDMLIDDSELNADIHASNEYRAHLVTVMARRAVDAAKSA
ncbi:MAG: FAD binding domain-containing protein [Gammaproteobacteria bacterium]